MPIKLLIFDCDGVILESVEAKTNAFRTLGQRWGEEATKRLVAFHDLHGGLSRLKKLEWLFQEVLHKPVSQEEIEALGQEFADLSLAEVMAAPYVPGFMETFEAYEKHIPIYVASGAPHDELCQVLKHKGIYERFNGVYGSPPVKNELVKTIVTESGVAPQECLMVGDSKTDLDAALYAGTKFYGRGLHFSKGGYPCYQDLTQLKEFIERQ